MNMDAWCEISRALLNDLVPKDGATWVFGHTLSDADFAALVDRESMRVDSLLIALGLAPGETEVRSLVQQLPRETLIALFSRWAHYHTAWQGAIPGENWVPPNQLWRAVFLAMSGDRQRAVDAALGIWPEAAAAFPALH